MRVFGSGIAQKPSFHGEAPLPHPAPRVNELLRQDTSRRSP